jgi:DNA-binding response OmpR family regulator
VTAPRSLRSKLSGRHILIAEDEMLIAFSLADMLTALGCTSMTAGRVAKAVLLAASERFDAAILDMNLAGEPGYPIADALSSRGVPFIIATGYGLEGIAANYQYRPILPKPYLPQQIEAALLKMFQ